MALSAGRDGALSAESVKRPLATDGQLAIPRQTRALTGPRSERRR